ncbi:MAG: hypothetical protein HC769_02335 [Cyanobacteria bacterium CRU_2_1]|nr:hypothetical protein [Cyanobacteria bacterium RU_5_0]NJR57790.1 hypothetical protein [Cyanobacteria bacterium CRU_2_1]
MLTSFKSLRQTSDHLLIGLIAIEVLIGLMYLGSIAFTGQVYPPVDFDGQATIPSLLQAMHFLTIGLLILWILPQPRSRFPHPSRPFLITFAVLLFYATIDEVFKVHLQLHHFLGGQYWKWLYLSSFTALMIWRYRDFAILWHHYRRETCLVFIGIVVFVIGGYGSEILKDVLSAGNSYEAIAQERIAGVTVENLRVAYEEFSELLGENLILYACLQFVGKRLEA